MRILGVDPGTTGALALFDSSKSVESGLRWLVEDMPPATAFRDWLRRYEPETCYFEDTFHVQASPYGSYTFGRAVGEQIGVLRCCDTPITFVHPATWKAYFRLRGKGKAGSLELARQYLPAQHHGFIARKMDHNRAEAVLIVAYGSSKLL